MSTEKEIGFTHESIVSAVQGTAVITTITASSQHILDKMIVNAPDGIAFEFKKETGELTLLSGSIGEFKIDLNVYDESGEEILSGDFTFVVSAEQEEETPPADKVETQPEQTAPAVETPVVDTKASEEVQPKVDPVVETPVVVAPAAVAAPAAEIEVTPATAELINFLNDYKMKMNIRAMVDTTLGVAQQTKLYKMLIKVLTKEGHDFTANMDALIAFVKANRNDVFAERCIGRFVPQLRLNKEEAMLFTRLTTLLIVTADVDNLTLVSSRIDFKFISTRLKNDAAMQRLQYYYNPVAE